MTDPPKQSQSDSPAPITRYPRLMEALSKGRITGSGRPDHRNRSLRSAGVTETQETEP